MASKQGDRAAEAAAVPGDLAGSVASALLWLDVASLSLQRDDLRDLKVALTHARIQLQGVVRRITAADRRSSDRRVGERRFADRRAVDRGTAERRSVPRRKGERRAADRRAAG